MSSMLPSIAGAANAGAALASATAPVHSARANTGTRANAWIVRVIQFMGNQPLWELRLGRAGSNAAAPPALGERVQGAACLRRGRGAVPVGRRLEVSRCRRGPSRPLGHPGARSSTGCTDPDFGVGSLLQGYPAV